MGIGFKGPAAVPVVCNSIGAESAARGTCRAKQKGFKSGAQSGNNTKPWVLASRSPRWKISARSSCFAADLSVRAAGSPPSHSKDENDQGGVTKEQEDEEETRRAALVWVEWNGMEFERSTRADPTSLAREI